MREKVLKFIVVSFLVLFFVFAVCTLADTFLNHKMGVPSVSTGETTGGDFEPITGEFVPDPDSPSNGISDVGTGNGSSLDDAEYDASTGGGGRSSGDR